MNMKQTRGFYQIYYMLFLLFCKLVTQAGFEVVTAIVLLIDYIWFVFILAWMKTINIATLKPTHKSLK